MSNQGRIDVASMPNRPLRRGVGNYFHFPFVAVVVADVVDVVL